jgi:ATP-dependent DNA helicase RecQ
VDLIIKEIKSGKAGQMPRDVFLTAPTGSGKSLLFQIPAFFNSVNGDVTIVVSPLIALKKDQVRAIKVERGFTKVAYINSELSYLDREKVIEDTNQEGLMYYIFPFVFVFKYWVFSQPFF